MTTKPKARKFRIRVGAGDRPPAPPPEEADDSASDIAAWEEDHARDAFDTMTAPASSKPRPSRRQAAGATDLDAIKAEGLTQRQLRLAQRVAQKHDLKPVSDFDAVRLLRQRGIDPFNRPGVLDIVDPAPMPAADAPAAPLPATVAPVPADSAAARREREIGSIQRDILQRRRRKMLTLVMRLALFVMLPTLVAGWYFYRVATPMYATQSEFLILQADNTGGSGVGGLLSGTQFATSQDSIAVQSYLQSKDAMLRLDRDAGFRAHFTQPWIDPIQRMDADPSVEAAYAVYKRRVKIGYDPTEGVIRMEVTAADPIVAADFSERLISYAEDRVNSLSQQKRGDQMRDAIAALDIAETQRRRAQEALVGLQMRGAVLDPDGVIGSLRGQISGFESQLQEKQLQLAALLDNPRPNQAKVDGTQADIRRLETLLEQLNQRMVDASLGENSLAQLSVGIQMAQADLATRDMMLQSALQQVEQTRMEANRQVRYLTTSVEPVSSEEPQYPRAFENTVLAFLIFAGIYLMLSLTASILREQVTS